MSACKDCRWFTPSLPFSLDGHLKPTGLCHYNPPLTPGFPVVYETDFCREFQVREQSTAEAWGCEDYYEVLRLATELEDAMKQNGRFPTIRTEMLGAAADAIRSLVKEAQL